MSSIIQSVEELIQATPDRNNQDFFAEMWQVLTSLRERVDQRFPTRLDPSVTDLASYGAADGSTKGHLSASSSDEIDWMVHSFMGTPAHSFSNMHLTIWLGPQVKVPHFGMALGTIPDLFVYSDLVPRTDLMTDLDYLDRYYGPRNDTFLEFEANPEFRPFVSREIYMRVAQSRTSLCYVAKPSTKALTQVSRAAHELLDQWLRELTPYGEAFMPPLEGNEETCDQGFFWNNSQFSYCDAMAYYAFLRRLQPTKVVEIGSGFSSLVAMEALKANKKGSLTCIEPYPRPFLPLIEGIELIKSPVQNISP